MNNLLDILTKAKNTYIFESKAQFIKCLDEIQLSDVALRLDWDDGAGEEWARFIHQEFGIVYMINSKIGIIFVMKNYLDKFCLQRSRDGAICL